MSSIYDIVSKIPLWVWISLLALSFIYFAISDAQKALRKKQTNLRFNTTTRRVVLTLLLGWLLFSFGSNLTGYQQIANYETFEFNALPGFEIATKQFLLILVAQGLALTFVAVDFVSEVLVKKRSRVWDFFSVFGYYTFSLYGFYLGLQFLFAFGLGILWVVMVFSFGLILSYGVIGIKGNLTNLLGAKESSSDTTLFKKRGTKMDIYLGKDKEGKDFYLDFKKENIHFILLLGATGSGKSIFHENLYRQVASNNTPEEAGFVFLDMTRVDFNRWEKSPYLYHPVTVDTDEATELLEKLAEESGLRAKDERGNSRAIFIHIEECDMFYSHPERVNNALAKILGHKDKNNMYLVFSTSRIDPEFLTNLLKLVDLKIVFHTATAKDSNFLLGNEDAWDLDEEFTPGERILAFKDRKVYCQPFTEEEVNKLEEDFNFGR